MEVSTMKNTVLTTPLITYVILVAAVLVLTGCPEIIEPTSEIRTFSVMSQRNNNNSSYTITASLRAQNNDAIIYVDKTETVDDETLNSILDEFSSNILPLVENTFNSRITDLDDNGKIILLLFDIDDGYEQSDDEDDSYIAGYFDPNDFFRTNTDSSNYGEILYIDTDPGLTIGDFHSTIYSTIVHELQHMIQFSSRLAAKPTLPLQETWILEGSAVLTEHLYRGAPITERILYYYLNPDVHPVDGGGGGDEIAKGNNFLVWGDGPKLLVDYASAYLFFWWLSLHGGEEILPAISASDHADYKAVIDALPASSGFSGTVGSSRPSQDIWELLLAQWFTATIVQNPTGLLGFKGWPGIPSDNLVECTNPKDPTNVRYFYPINGILSSSITLYVDSMGQQRFSGDPNLTNFNNYKLLPGNRLAVLSYITHSGGTGSPAVYGIDISLACTNKYGRVLGIDTGTNTLEASETAKNLLIVFNSSTNPDDKTPTRTGTFTIPQPPPAASVQASRSAGSQGFSTAPDFSTVQGFSVRQVPIPQMPDDIPPLPRGIYIRPPNE